VTERLHELVAEGRAATGRRGGRPGTASPVEFFDPENIGRIMSAKRAA
jgi:hypothetical protein